MSLTGRGREHIPTCFSRPVYGAEPVAYIYPYPKIPCGCGHVGWSILGELTVSVRSSGGTQGSLGYEIDGTPPAP